MKIEIIGYDLVNGEKQTHKVFKNNIVNSLAEVDLFEEKIKNRYFKQHNEEIQCFAIYKYNPNKPFKARLYH